MKQHEVARYYTTSMSLDKQQDPFAISMLSQESDSDNDENTDTQPPLKKRSLQKRISDAEDLRVAQNEVWAGGVVQAMLKECHRRIPQGMKMQWFHNVKSALRS